MNLLEANGINDLFNYIFSDWIIALFIFFAGLILLAVLFKGLKVGLVLVTIAAVIAGLIVLAAFVFMLITWDILRIIDFAIKWGPTILFVTIITVSTLVNSKRGLRKSLILLAQAVGACIICIIFFYVCVTSEEVDKALLGIVNKILGNNTLQGMLGVSEDCLTIRQIVAEWLPNVVGGDMKILLAANPEYIVTLVDMVFRIVFTVVTILLYFLLVFLMYIIYFFAYPERRYKKKIKRMVEKNQTDRTYKKHHIGGGAVGLVRGVTVGLLTLSFMGSAMFMVAGGLGTGTMGNYDLENDDYNFYYSIYRSVDSYGAQGIFKLLNSMKDSSDTPFYLFAADMVLSGNLDDEDNGINDENIKFREEIAAYMGFAKGALNLLMKYGEDDMVDIINGRGGNNAFDKIVNIMSIPEFRAEFDVLIEEFDTETYIINLGLSLVTTIAEHIDEISFASSIGEDNKELIKLLFKKDYLTDIIPDESELKQDIEAGKISPDEVESRPTIKLAHLLTKDDIRIVLKVAFAILAGEQETKDTLGLVKELLPDVRQLSILKTLRSGELNPVLARLYCYFGNKYLTAEGEEGITYSSVSGKNIKWLDELNTLLDVAPDALSFWNNIYDEHKTALDMALWAFDGENPARNDNEKYFENICDALESSQIIGTVMSTSYVYNAWKKSLVDISENVYVPKDLQYSTVKNADGSVIYGELHQFFCGFKILLSKEYSDILNNILDLANGKEIDITAFLDVLEEALPVKDKYGNTLSYYLTESNILRSVISICVIEKGNDTVYIPIASLDKLKDGTSVNMINKVELKQIFDNISIFIEFLQPLKDGESQSDYLARIAEYLYDGKLSELIASNRIVEGTVANMLSKYVTDNEFIVVPAHLTGSIDGWITLNGKKGELRNLLDALQTAEIDIVKIAEGNFDTDDLFNTILDLKKSDMEVLLSSQILHYTLSNYIIDGAESGGFKIIVPYGARTLTPDGDVIPYTVKKSELITLFETVAGFDLLDGDTDISSVLYKLVTNKDKLDNSLIMSASIAYTIANNGDVQSSLTLPQKYIDAGKEEALLDYNSSNAWKYELKRFINALDEILGISSGEEFVFDSESIQDSLSVFLTQLNKSSRVNPEVTKLSLCYESEIIRSEITVRLDETLIGNDIVPEDVVKATKYNGYYTEAEIQALANALEIFGIDDLLGITGDDLISEITDKVFTLNDPLEEYEKQTGLQVIYASNIIRYIFSNKLDEALENNINKEVIYQIKGASSYYPVQDIADLIDAANEMQITDFDNIADFDFSSIEDLTDTSHLFPESGKTRLGIVYSSRIAAGVITKNLSEKLNSESTTDAPVDHPKAYRDDLKVYKQSEIESLFKLFGNLDDIDINTVDLDEVSAILYDENGDTHSWLIASAISNIFVEDDSFIIPTDVVEDGCILPRETSLVISVFSDLSEGKSIEDLENWEIEGIPAEPTRSKLFASEIMRARVTYDIGEEANTSGKSVYVTTSRIKNTRDTTGVSRFVILEDELAALAAALDKIGTGEGSTFAIPSLTFEEISSYDKETVEALLASDIMYHKVCESLLSNSSVSSALAGDTTFTKEVVDLRDGSSPDEGDEGIKIIRKEAIINFLKLS